jgi:hypothetical protein
MKLKLAALAIVLALGSSCAKTATAPVPGQINTFDAYAYRVLYDAQAAINSFKGSTSAQNPNVKPILNQAIADYDIAESAYQVWHAAGGTGSTAAITAAITKVQTDIAGIAGAAGGK